MADEDNNHLPRDWGHLKSPFFKLPPEVRNKIYRDTFTGSRIELFRDPPLGFDIVPVTGRRTIFSSDKPKHNFLLTCFQVYCEALAIYWSSTVVDNGYDSHFTRGYFLNRIPAIARPYIQHLRNVSLKPCSEGALRWLQDQAIGWDDSLAESFSSFPNLKSCSIREWNTPSALSHAIDTKVIILGSSVEDITRYSPWPMIRSFFYNVTSEKSLIWYQPLDQPEWLSEENAFKMLMDPAPGEIEFTRSCFQSMAEDYFGEDFMDEVDY